MNLRVVLALLCAAAAASAALAETVAVGDKIMVRESNTPRPSGGMLMADVERRFGAPVTRHAAVGEPPITRWDYAQFSVFFERDRVIHSVVTEGAPPADAAAKPAAPTESAPAPQDKDAAPTPSQEAPPAPDAAAQKQ
ncbi:MAG TPA: hypothetical protein VMG11_01780 [Steroidobacteraceae bacterium]|nr:hypothetical protein [Steroidobacteraceae bacterium]